MRSVIAFAVLILLAAVATGHAQNDKPSSPPPSGAPATLPAPQAQAAPEQQQPRVIPEQEPGITVRQEDTLPYRPCDASVVYADGRHGCLGGR